MLGMPGGYSSGSSLDDDDAESLAAIEEEVRAGLPMHRQRMDAMRANEDFYELRNASYIELRESEDMADFQRRPKRTSRMTRKAVETLTSLLYAPGPDRVVKSDKAVDAWLDGVYKSIHMNAIMSRADKKATLNDACALGFDVTGDPENPIRIRIWGGHEFVPFFSEAEPMVPWAICTLSVIFKGGKKQRRYDLWSKAEHRVYKTKPIDWTYSFETSGGTRADYVADLSTFADPTGAMVRNGNPFGRLPFSYVYNTFPVDGFWGGGIGSALREANAEVDRELSDIAEHVQKFLNPRAFLRNVSINFRMRDQPGHPIHLPAKESADEGGPPPEIFYLQAALAVQEAWYDAEKYANTTFYELEVPLSAVRDDTDGPSSGLQVVAESAGLVKYTKARQALYTFCETEAARLVIECAGNYFGEPQLLAAAQALDLDVSWPTPAFPIQSSDQDESDNFELTSGLCSQVELIARRRGLTQEAAKRVAKEIADDRAYWATLQPKPDPAALDATDPNQADQNQGGQPPEGTEEDV